MNLSQFKQRTYTIIFEHGTKAGRAFDIALIICVLVSVFTVMLETVQTLFSQYKEMFFWVEWFFTGVFTVELALRLYCAPKRWAYVKSFYGVIDILAILPTYLAYLVPGAQSFIIIRAMRLLRVFRILKLSNYTDAGKQLAKAMNASRPKIIVFIFFVVTLVTIVGTLIFYIEGRQNGFTSIPKSIYWAIVTMTTVGYGDITPLTPLGQFLSSILMITGYGVIAVPTGILSTEMAKLEKIDSVPEAPACSFCAETKKIYAQAKHCFECGARL